MRALQLFFRLHRPYLLKDLTEGEYFGGEAEFREANRLEYQPFLAILERNTQKFPKLRLSLAISGVWLEQAEKWDPELIRRLKKLVNLGKVELVATPFYNSLASFYSPDEFETQMDQQKRKISQVFGVEPKVVAFPELIYHDKLAQFAEKAGFSGVLAGAAESILDYVSANQVFLAEGCKNLRVICQNTRFSEAIRKGLPLVLVEEAKLKREFSANSAENTAEMGSSGVSGAADGVRNVGQGVSADVGVRGVTGMMSGNDGGSGRRLSHRTSAAEFVKGMSGLKRPQIARARIVKARSEMTGIQVFSAKKFQKELELESLRGNLITLTLDTGIFRQHQGSGVVRFFDELIANWLKVPGNRFVSASEMLEIMEPTRDLSVKTTVSWHSNDDSASAKVTEFALESDIQKAQNSSRSVARLEDVHYCPPGWARNMKQIEMEKRLYSLREGVLAVKDTLMYQDFQRLTELMYIQQNRDDQDGDGLSFGRFQAILADFEEKLGKKLPEPLKLASQTDDKTAKNVNSGASGSAKSGDKAENEGGFEVKVRRVKRVDGTPSVRSAVGNRGQKGAGAGAADTMVKVAFKPGPAGAKAKAASGKATGTADIAGVAGAAGARTKVKRNLSSEPRPLKVPGWKYVEDNAELEGTVLGSDGVEVSDWDDLVWQQELWEQENIADERDGEDSTDEDGWDELRGDEDEMAEMLRSEMAADDTAEPVSEPEKSVETPKEIEETDEMDNAATEVQIMAQRLKRQNAGENDELEILSEAVDYAEAELVTPAEMEEDGDVSEAGKVKGRGRAKSKSARRKTRAKIVLD